ncbi:MAG: SulP family inorganic anion transporter [Actinomycetes bacterium]
MTANLPSTVNWWTHTITRIRAVAPRRADYARMRHDPGKNILAGITVGIVALPLALGFGITSGMGASAGLITAIVAGTLAALLGGSNLQVSGPTGAMTVVLVPIVAAHGASGVLVVALMAGILLIVMALAGIGRYVRYVPLPVIEGFTLGIAVIIALQQIPTALGVQPSGERIVSVAGHALAEWARDPRWTSIVMAAVVVVVILAVGRFRPTLPIALVAVAAATVLTQLLHLAVPQIGKLSTALAAPSLPDVQLSSLRDLAIPAVAVATLAALESLLSATVADAMTVSERHDPDRELFGQGIANVVTPLFGGIPATAAIARTAVNVRSGASSRLAALVHAAVLLLIVLLLVDVVALIPLAALAGVLIATAIRMVEVSSVRALMHSSRSDFVVLAVTFVATVALDLATAVILGIVAAGAMALRQMARSASLHELALDDFTAADDSDHSTEERALLDEHIVAYRFEGPLFFGGAHAALLELTEVSDVRVAVLRLSHLTTMDRTGAEVLADTIRSLERRGVTVIVSGLPTRFDPVLSATGVHGELSNARHLFEHTPDAISHARRHVSRHAATRHEDADADDVANAPSTR